MLLWMVACPGTWREVVRLRDLVFQNFEEALAAYVLGPFLFRCSVCGRTHKSAGRGWAACAAKLMRDHALSSWASPDARHTVLAADALAAAAGDSAMTVMLARVGPAPVVQTPPRFPGQTRTSAADPRRRPNECCGLRIVVVH